MSYPDSQIGIYIKTQILQVSLSYAIKLFLHQYIEAFITYF